MMFKDKVFYINTVFNDYIISDSKHTYKIKDSSQYQKLLSKNAHLCKLK